MLQNPRLPPTALGPSEPLMKSVCDNDIHEIKSVPHCHLAGPHNLPGVRGIHSLLRNTTDAQKTMRQEPRSVTVTLTGAPALSVAARRVSVLVSTFCMQLCIRPLCPVISRARMAAAQTKPGSTGASRVLARRPERYLNSPFEDRRIRSS
jgi:hypothetical protein